MKKLEKTLIRAAELIARYCEDHSCEDCPFLEIINVDIHTSMAPVTRCALVNKALPGESVPHRELPEEWIPFLDEKMKEDRRGL